LQIR